MRFLGTNFTFQSHFCKDFYTTDPKIVFSRYMTTNKLMLASKTMAWLLKCPNAFWDKDTAVLTENKQLPLFISSFLPLIHTVSILYYCLISQLDNLILRVSAFLHAIKPNAALHMLYTLTHTVDPAGSCEGSCIKPCLESNTTFSTAPVVHSSLLSPTCPSQTRIHQGRRRQQHIRLDW